MAGWLKMPRPQRLAAMAIVAAIVAVSAIRAMLPRPAVLPQELEQQARQLASFRAEIDSAGIDTVIPEKKSKKKNKKTPPPDRKLEEVPME